MQKKNKKEVKKIRDINRKHHSKDKDKRKRQTEIASGINNRKRHYCMQNGNGGGGSSTVLANYHHLESELRTYVHLTLFEIKKTEALQKNLLSADENNFNISTKQ